VIETPVQASPFYNLITANHIQSVSDNCAIETVELSEDRFSCSEIGTSFEIQLEATDIYGNSSTCNSIVTAKSVPLNPNYLSSLCLADSLQLFANLDPAFVQSYIWTGPDNFRSQEADPIIHNINNSNSGTYFLAVTTRNGCTFFGSLDITIDEFYNPVIASDTTDYCLNEDVFLSASIFTEQVNYLWYEGIPPAGNLVNETTDPVLVLNPSPGKHFYYVEIMSEICNSNPSPVIAIDVLPQPAAEVDHVFITICEGEDIILSTSIFSSILNYEWTGPNGYFSRDRLPAVIEDTDLSDGGVYTLTIDNGICSSDPAYTQVTIFEQPPRPEITSNGVFCEGQNAVLDVLNTPTGIRYHWFKNGQLFNSTSSNSLLLTGISGIDTGAYTVVVEDGICFSDTSKVHFVSIEDRIPIGATNNGPVCEGEEILLSSTFIPGALYLWEDPAGQLFSGREISVSASQGTYKLTVTSENNCLAETTTEVIVDVRPEITALSNTSLNCMSSDMDISFFPTVFPVGDYIYEWSGPGMFDSNLENPVITMLDSSINGTYTLQVIKENCASSPATTEVEITIKPEIPEIQLSNHPCIGDTFEIVIQNPVSGQMVEWLWTTPLGLVTTFEPFLKINGFNNNFAGNYTVIQSFNDCRSEKSESIFLDNPVIPEKPNINGLGIICEGDNLIFSTETINGASYVWNTPKGPIITSAPNLEIQNINTTDEGTYSLYIELGSCISPSSDIINLSVLTKPAPPSFPIDTLGFCINEVESIDICLESYPVTGDVNYILINRLNGQVILEQDSPCFDLSFLNTGVQKEYTLTAVIELNDCQSDLSNDILLEFNEIPSQGAITELPSYIVCGETSVSININNPQSYPVNYSSPNADLVISEIEPFEILVSNLNIGLNQIILSSSFKQCIDFYNDTTELIVLDKPVANDDDFTIQYSPAIVLDILQNDQISYPIAPIEFSNLNHGNISFTDGQVQYIPVPGISENIEFDYTICYESCQDECDDAHVTISIEGNEDCRIGNIITPNRDGYNDYFTIECLENNAYPDNALNIYNQWGDVIFSASPYNNDWDGSFN
ncbi:MAG: T9SS type B sorting domain-containing protein, partial [Saprospiraceae bacterium]|nr:T9SS type B sorting domain-containing protein [Saprospiraceae bacterium]